ncbi:hypothetical protein E2C01_060223 [Portunus trituberculatus]|uniref:Uncharacterized protein n=1 Tax=Portunus trituberculatus TaxID=210409 RepID=A0A5B7H1P0_PORTR|nr:hypothetical protein [Portunus trituberculatus]
MTARVQFPDFTTHEMSYFVFFGARVYVRLALHLPAPSLTIPLPSIHLNGLPDPIHFRTRHRNT